MTDASPKTDELVERIARAICAKRYGSMSHWESGGKHALLREAEAVLSCLEENGMAVVPREPTEEMLDIGKGTDLWSGADRSDTDANARGIWKNMVDTAALSASPKG